MSGRGAALACVAAWLACQAWLLPTRWVNPDEGAHLMDARLVMDGLVPIADFSSRQPLYVYTYVPFLRLFGSHYPSGRLMPLAATLLATLVLYAIGRRLAGHGVGVSAALWHLFAPTILINAPMVKTEPLANLLTASGICALLIHLDKKAWRPLGWSGVALGAGYYVRESTLGGLLAAGLMVLARIREGFALTVRRLGVLIGGYIAVCAAVMAFYSRHLPWERILTNSTFSPFSRAIGTAYRLASLWTPKAERTATEALAAVSAAPTAQPASAILGNLREVLALNAHLVAGALVAVLLLAGMARGRVRGGKAAGASWGFVVGLSWFGSMTAAYAFHIATKGFFQFYFRELILPLALLLALVLRHILPGDNNADARIVGVTIAGIGAGVGTFVLQRLMPGAGAFYALAVVGAAGWFMFRGELNHKQRMRAAAGYAAFVAAAALGRFTPMGGFMGQVPAFGIAAAGAAALLILVRITRRRLAPAEAGRFLGLAAVGIALIASATLAARRLSPAYDCVWSPATVTEVATLVRRHSAPGDEVLSGGVIWEFEAGRAPFLNISHPLQYQYGMDDEERRAVEERLAVKPPRIVVMDGYTEQTYARHVPALRALLTAAYESVGEVAGSRHPVRVYVLREPAS